MTLAERAVRHPITTSMVVVAVVLMGTIAFSRLALDLLPELDFPAVSVVAEYPGVGPEEIETLVTRPIEESMATVQGIDRIESTSIEGLSRVRLRFTWGTDIDVALNDVRANLDRLRDRLPEDLPTPTVYKFNLTSFPIVFLSVAPTASDADASAGTTEEGRMRLRLLVERHLKPRLERVDGVALVDIRGGLRREIHVSLDPARLESLRLSADAVILALNADNQNLPAGDVRDAGKEVIVRTLAEFESVDEIQDVVVTVRDGTPIRIRDIATVVDAFEDPTNAVLVDGAPGVRLSISKKAGANTVDVAEAIQAEVARINTDFPEVKLTTVIDSSDFIKSSISNVQQGVVYGALLAIIVLFFFLRGVGATIVIATAIPVSVIATFGMMYVAGFTMNMITFAGLALGVGLLVDGAIVILENVVRKRDEGLPPKKAAVEGSREVSRAVVASVVTNFAVFVPVIFISGFAGILFAQMAWVVIFSMVCSLAVALTLVPMLASRLMRREAAGKAAAPAGASDASSTDAFSKTRSTGRQRAWVEKVEAGYERALRWMLAHPVVTLSAGAGTFVVAILLIPLVGVELMPAADEGVVDVRLQLPVGTPLEKTEAALALIESRALPVIERDLVIREAIAGRPGFWSTRGASTGSLRFRMVPADERDRSVDEVVSEVRKAIGDIPGYDIRVRPRGAFFLTRMLSGGDERLSLEIIGYDLETSSRLGREAKAILSAVPGITDVRVDREDGSPEAVIRIDRAKATSLGLSAARIGDTLETYVLGKTATYFREGGDEFKVLVRLEGADTLDVDELLSLPVFRGEGLPPVMLRNVVHTEPRVGPMDIERLNQNRILSISAGFDADKESLGEVADRAMAAIRGGMAVPDGFVVRLGGELEEQDMTFGDLMLGLILAVILTYMVMASLFESLLHPFVVMFSIPMAVIGVVLALLATGTTFNLYAFIGIIVLVGVVVNNAIVLVDYINLMRRERKLPLVEAVVKTGRMRIRPILMTTLTTLLALLPVAIGIGEGSEQQTPLARAVFGGLLASTVVTLGVVPVAYVAAERAREWVVRTRARMGWGGAQPAPGESAPSTASKRSTEG